MLVSNCVLHQVPGLQTVSPWELLVQFVAISHFILPLLITLYYFPSFHIRETLCSLSLETKKRIWKVWIKNYIWKTILKYVFSTYFKNEIYLQFICSHKNIHMYNFICFWQPHVSWVAHEYSHYRAWENWCLWASGNLGSLLGFLRGRVNLYLKPRYLTLVSIVLSLFFQWCLL